MNRQRGAGLGRCQYRLRKLLEHIHLSCSYRATYRRCPLRSGPPYSQACTETSPPGTVTPVLGLQRISSGGEGGGNSFASSSRIRWLKVVDAATK